MENSSQSDTPELAGPQPRRLNRRQMIAGTGLAAAAWAAPSIVHIDVASAAGSGLAPSFIEVKPNVALSSPCIALTGDSGMISTSNTSTVPGPPGDPVIGKFGFGEPLGQLFRTTVTGAPAHTMVNIFIEICYTNWEGMATQDPADIDRIDILLEGSSLFGGQIIPSDFYPGGVDELCVSDTFSVPHSLGTLTLDVQGASSSTGDDFGIRCLQIEFV